jgi:glycosyltransferase involved in cell wall biosynthesis
MPTFRRAGQIGQSIQSLLNGDLGDFELIVTDDGASEDGTAAAVAGAAKGDSRVRYYRNSSKLGMPGNLNAGIAMARGEFVAVCHDHDLYDQCFLSTMVGTLRRHPSAQFVHCALEMIDQAGRPSEQYIGPWPELSLGREWLDHMLMSFTCSVCALSVVRRSTYEAYGTYRPDHGFISDVEMWMRLSLHGDVCYVPTPLIRVREREDAHPERNRGLIHLMQLAKIHRTYARLTYSGPRLIWQRVIMELRLVREILIGSASVVVRRIRRFIRIKKTSQWPNACPGGDGEGLS